jgi:alpha-beta hydrolase superfamily lysophospholipase
MSEHAARYAELAAALVERGFAVYANDHRGHGRSIVEGEEPGHMADEDAFGRAVGDVHRLAGLVAERHPGLRRILLGHSMGSFLVQQLMADHPGDAHGFALSASNGKPPPIAAAGRLLARVERRRLGKRGRSTLLAALSFDDFNKRFAPTRSEFDWLSRDDREVDKYIDDPLCGFFCSTESWVDLLDALGGLTSTDYLDRIPKDKPVYAFAGSEDPVGGAAGVRALVDAYRGAWMTDVTLRIYQGGRHEMLHEINRREVIAELVDWCERTASG